MAEIDEILHHVRGEGPSAEFVLRLRERVVAEADRAVVRIDDPGVEMSTDLSRPRPPGRPSSSRRGGWLLALAAASVLALVSLVMLADRSSTLTTSDGSTSSATDPTTSMPGQTSPSQPTGVVNDHDTAALLAGLGFLEEGTYQTGIVGTPLSIRADVPLWVHTNSDARLELSRLESNDSGDRWLAVTRLTMLADPDDPAGVLTGLDDGWPASDLDGWLDAVDDTFAISDRRATTVGGLSTVRFDIEIENTPSGCDDDSDDCALLGTNQLVNDIRIGVGTTARVWLVSQDEEAPLALVATLPSDSDSDWFDVVADLVGTIEFGPVAGDRFADTASGVAEFEYLGGVRFDVGEPTAVAEQSDSFGQIPLADRGSTDFMRQPLDADGEPIGSTDELVETVRSGQSIVREVDAVRIEEFAARVFDITGVVGNRPPLRRGPGDDRGWWPPTRGRLWVIEHPERGLLVIAAGSFRNDVETLDETVDRTQGFLDSLVFVESR